MIDTTIEESCVYCSKCLTGLNDFNRKMHIDTCKVRKLVDANHGTLNDSQLDNFIVVGDNCSYCFKSFNDFKSDFNKRLHIKCCKIKKETYDEKNNTKMNMGGEHCVFCTKPLANLNEFNKRMHIENCKIRKSIENSGSPSNKRNKDENLIKLGIELGDNCPYCSKSFVNLSDFNKKLHFEYCKLKKRKLVNMNGSLNASIGCSSDNLNCTSDNVSLSNSFNSTNVTTINSIALNNQLSSTPNNNSNNNSNPDGCNDPNKIGKLDLGESCLFCSRSLVNLSNFNKRIHIETCKIKSLKKATSKLRQTTTKAPRKRQPKKDKINDNTNNSINNLYCQNLNKTLTLELMGSNLGNLVCLNVDQQQLINNSNSLTNTTNTNINAPILPVTVSQLNQLHQQQQQPQQIQPQHQSNNNASISQFDSLVASLNHSNTLNLSQMQQHMNNQINNQQQQQIKIDSNGQYRQNSDGIYI